MLTPNNCLTSNQGEKLRELGLYLHEVRCKRSLSLDTLSHKTRIPARLIEAIETANSEALPEPIYIRALIQRIGNALQANGAELAAAFPVETHLQSIKPTWTPVASSQLRPLHMYLVYIIVLIGAVSGLSLLIRPPAANVARPSTTPTTPATTQAVSDVQQAAVNPPADPPQQQTETQISSDKVIVSMTLQDDCWLRVVADGNVVFEGTLPKGEKRTWEAKEQVTVMAGNAGGVVVAINNEEAKPLGTPGSVETVTYRPPNEGRS